jgi:16S rRNA C1402 (ribose-2'-O) methylase RsmI
MKNQYKDLISNDSTMMFNSLVCLDDSQENQINKSHSESIMKSSKNSSISSDFVINEAALLEKLKSEQNNARRAEIIRELGDSSEAQVMKTLWSLRNDLEKESDDRVKREIKLGLHKITTQKFLTQINIDFFLETLEVFKSN